MVKLPMSLTVLFPSIPFCLPLSLFLTSLYHALASRHSCNLPFFVCFFPPFFTIRMLSVSLFYSRRISMCLHVHSSHFLRFLVSRLPSCRWYRYRCSTFSLFPRFLVLVSQFTYFKFPNLYLPKCNFNPNLHVAFLPSFIVKFSHGSSIFVSVFFFFSFVLVSILPCFQWA